MCMNLTSVFQTALSANNTFLTPTGPTLPIVRHGALSRCVKPGTTPGSVSIYSSY